MQVNVWEARSTLARRTGEAGDQAAARDQAAALATITTTEVSTLRGEPRLITSAAVERSARKDLLSGRSRVRVTVGAQVIHHSQRTNPGFVPFACQMT
jgi:hypothetical protein